VPQDPRFKQARLRPVQTRGRRNERDKEFNREDRESESPLLALRRRRKGRRGGGTDLDRAMIPRAQTRRLEHTSLAAISEFASAILSIEAPPLLTEAEILFAFFIFPLVS